MAHQHLAGDQQFSVGILFGGGGGGRSGHLHDEVPLTMDSFLPLLIVPRSTVVLWFFSTRYATRILSAIPTLVGVRGLSLAEETC
jgi:hypothetical protein